MHRTDGIDSSQMHRGASLVFGAGVIGGLVASLVYLTARALHLSAFNPELLLGTLLTRQTGALTWLLGLILELTLAGGLARVYAGGFRLLGRADTGLGILMGGAHWLASGLVLGFFLPLHPLAPSSFGIIGSLAFLVAHLLYGGIVGNLYQPVHRTQSVPQSHLEAAATQKRAA